MLGWWRGWIAGAPPDSLIVTDGVTRCALPLCLFTICNLCPLAVAVLLLPEGHSSFSLGGGELPARLAQGGIFALVDAVAQGAPGIGERTGLTLAVDAGAGGAGGVGHEVSLGLPGAVLFSDPF